MIRVDVVLLPVEGKNAAAAETANAVAKHSSDHLRYLIGNRKCRKHPSNNNRIRLYATLDEKNPKMEIMSICCTDFYKRLK